jgi:hypothetical protein
VIVGKYRNLLLGVKEPTVTEGSEGSAYVNDQQTF